MMGAVFDALASGRMRLRRARNLRAGARASARGSVSTAARTSAGEGARQGAKAASSAPRVARPVVRPPAAPAPSMSASTSRRIAAWRPRMPSAAAWLAVVSLLLAIGGAVLIAVHARWIAAAGAPDPQAASRAGVFRDVLPGARLHVPAVPGATLVRVGDASVLVASGLRAEPVRRIDLCTQLADPADPAGRWLTLRIGDRFADVAALVQGASAAPRNLVLADEAMPRIEIGGPAVPLRADAPPLALRWQGHAARWISDTGAGAPLAGEAGRATLARQGWLVWDGDHALRIARRSAARCPALGELVLQLVRRPLPGAGDPMPAGPALVAAFPARGEPVEARLAAGDYDVPRDAAPPLEDRQLFEALNARGLVRLRADGLAELAPSDLVAWRAQGRTGWDAVPLDDETRRLLRHLYGRADGDFVREQVRIFNGERRLLAWRMAADPGPANGAVDAAVWRAEVGGMPLPLADDMPAAGARLFAAMPQGWGPWRRVASWPGAGGTAGHDGSTTLHLQLTDTQRGKAQVRLLLAGHLMGVQGARVMARMPACDGRACTAVGEVETLDLALDPGARELVLRAAPLGMEALVTPGDARYRHLAARDGALVWKALPGTTPHSSARAAEVALVDRRGTPLWGDGAPSDAARAAGLGTLLGVHAGQDNGVAGMLARLPTGTGLHRAALTLDLPLQRAARDALDCIAMRRGRWQDGACAGGSAPPAGRQAGAVVLDTETGAILAAAGAGTAPVDAANWREARDFDRIDPATSPLRLPALQHDGGSRRSPGSTFKIVSALGLELAAKSDPRLDALLDGMPLAAINLDAARRGWDFRTDAPTYPAGVKQATTGARITNFRDQGLDRHAADGRLGLAQALTYSLNTWFAWMGELADASLFGKAAGGAPDLQPLAPGALDPVRPIVAMARRLGFGSALRLDGGLLPADYAWSAWDALQTTPAGIDPVHTRHELRQMAIGLRMQATPLQMALAAGAVGQGRVVHPYLLAELDGIMATPSRGAPLGVRLDRIRAGMKGVVDVGTASGAFRAPALDGMRRGLSGKTGTAPVGEDGRATVWFTGWLEPGSLPGQAHRLALAVFVSDSEATGGEHAAPVAAAILGSQAARRLGASADQRGE